MQSRPLPRSTQWVCPGDSWGRGEGTAQALHLGENTLRITPALTSTALATVLAATALAPFTPAAARAQEVRVSGPQRVLSHDGGQILACRGKSSSGFIESTWAIRNTRNSDVVKATVKHRDIDFGGNWSEWQLPYSKTGWINPGVTRNISKTSSSDATWANHQTRVTLTSRASDTSRTRVFTWNDLPRC